MNNLEKILEFFHLIGRLKTTYRFKASENYLGDSSADHSWRLAVMTFVLAEELKLDIDILRAVKIALVHDLAESITGDIDARLIANKIFTKEEKNRKELEVMEEYKEMLPEKIGLEVFELWEDYFLGKSREAKYVKTLDKIEATVHIQELGAVEYDDLELLGTYGNEEIKGFPELCDFFRLVKKEIKKELEEGGFSWKEEFDV